ncbi:MAG: hypothetical protein RLZZ118_930 [Bacteroidota bacterium]|jgi:exonuclease III
MKIVTWNCNGALRNKFQHLSEFEADIYIIQECENPELSRNENYMQWAGQHLWQGDNKNKGIGIFVKNNNTIEAIHWGNIYKGHKVKHFLPCLINNKLQLLAIWTSKNSSPNFGYIGQLWKYLEINKVYFDEIILAGDFNSNSIWDEWDRWWNHSDVVENLSQLKIYSLYHKFFKEEQGKESNATFFMHRNILKPYHIDYIFGSNKFASNISNFVIGDRDMWIKHSDHLPLVSEFNI